jgi:hypothetical protein
MFVATFKDEFFDRLMMEMTIQASKKFADDVINFFSQFQVCLDQFLVVAQNPEQTDVKFWRQCHKLLFFRG